MELFGHEILITIQAPSSSSSSYLILSSCIGAVVHIFRQQLSIKTLQSDIYNDSFINHIFTIDSYIDWNINTTMSWCRHARDYWPQLLANRRHLIVDRASLRHRFRS